MNINSFPNLIICGDSSLVKVNGLPYAAPVRNDGNWIWLASRNRAPFQILLELLWTRLAGHFKLGDGIFGADLEVEAFRPLCAAKLIKSEKELGWEYEDMTYLDDMDLKAAQDKPWQPVEISELEQILIIELGKSDIDLNDVSLSEFCTKKNTSLEAVINSLRSKGFAAPLNGKLSLLTRRCASINLPDGRIVAADNHSGRLMRWAQAFVETVQTKRQSDK